MEFVVTKKHLEEAKKNITSENYKMCEECLLALALKEKTKKRVVVGAEEIRYMRTAENENFNQWYKMSNEAIRLRRLFDKGFFGLIEKMLPITLTTELPD